jgi:hypothetical protein
MPAERNTDWLTRQRGNVNLVSFDWRIKSSFLKRQFRGSMSHVQ